MGPKTPIPSAVSPISRSSEFDVELVSREPRRMPAVPAKGFQISGRDWLMLAIGAGSVIGAGLLGWVLSLLVRR
jgi:hypothetical protein